MLNKVKETIAKENLLQMGDKIVVAVSGGPDSVALLHVLWSLKDMYQLSLYVCHLNHMLRGEDAIGDADYVGKLSKQLGLESFIFSKDIEVYSKKMKMSFEEAAREARYELFDTVLKRTGANKIAVGQNMNDQAETFLMRLFRGSGLEGLTAIKFQRDHIIRPLLNVKRDVIEQYCMDHELLTRRDHTNFETTYVRNKIRLEMIPYIKDNFNENIVQKLYDTTQLLNTDLDFIQSYVETFFHEVVYDGHKMKCSLSEIDSLHFAVKSRVIRKMINTFLGDIKGVGFKMVSDVIQLISFQHHGSCIMIKEQVKFEISYESLLIYKIDENSAFKKVPYTTNDVVVYNGKTFKTIDLPETSSKKNNITIDENKIKGQLYLRTREEGDRFVPLGMTGSKKLSDFFVNIKVPVSDRDKILLLCDDENIIWVVGHRMSDLYKIDHQTVNRITFVYE